MDVLGRQWKDYTVCNKSATQTHILYMEHFIANIRKYMQVFGRWRILLRITGLLLLIYFHHGDAQENLRTNFCLTVSSSTQRFWRLISRTCCTCHLLGPTNPLKWQWQPAVAHLSRYGLENQHLDRQDLLSLQNMTGFFNFLSSKARFEGERRAPFFENVCNTPLMRDI